MDSNNMNQDQNQQNFNQQPMQQPVYTAPVMQQTELEAPVSLGDWMITYLLTAIPCVNIIMLLVWAFGNGAPKSKSNWAKAVLIWALIGIVIGFVISAVFGAAFAELANSYGGY